VTAGITMIDGLDLRPAGGGARKIEEAAPFWQAAQQEYEAQIGPERASRLLRDFLDIAGAALIHHTFSSIANDPRRRCASGRVRHPPRGGARLRKATVTSCICRWRNAFPAGTPALQPVVLPGAAAAPVAAPLGRQVAKRDASLVAEVAGAQQNASLVAEVGAQPDASPVAEAGAQLDASLVAEVGAMRDASLVAVASPPTAEPFGRVAAKIAAVAAPEAA
jgi:hypothetical protein